MEKSPDRPRMRIQLYSKRRCSLCEDAHAALQKARERYVFELEVRYLEDSPDAYSRFRYEVPVVLTEAGERLFTYRVDPEALDSWLREHGTPVAPSRANDA